MKRQSFVNILILLSLGCSSMSITNNAGKYSIQEPKHIVKRQPGEEQRAQIIFNPHYQLWFHIDGLNDDFQAKTLVTFSLIEKAYKVLPEIYLDFQNGNIESVKVNGQNYFTPNNKVWRIDQNKIYFQTEKLNTGLNQIQISYTQPYANNEQGLVRFKDSYDGQYYFYLNVKQDSPILAFPSFNQSDLKARFELTVEIPTNWLVISNIPERLVSTVDGRKSWQFPPSPLLNPNLFSLNAGPFKVFKYDSNGIPLRLLVRHSLYQHKKQSFKIEHWFSIIHRGINDLSSKFVTEYPFSKLDQILAPNAPFQTSEAPGVILLNETNHISSLQTNDVDQKTKETLLNSLSKMWSTDSPNLINTQKSH